MLRSGKKKGKANFTTALEVVDFHSLLTYMEFLPIFTTFIKISPFTLSRSEF